MWSAIGCAARALTTTRAPAEALLVIEAESGKVLYAANAAHPWYPASVTTCPAQTGRLGACRRILHEDPLYGYTSIAVGNMSSIALA